MGMLVVNALAKSGIAMLAVSPHQVLPDIMWQVVNLYNPHPTL
jgi:hypothetical protein